MYKHLFQPYQINSMRLENRLVLTAMVTRLSGEDGFVNDDIRDRYLRFAQGEVGLIVMEAMAVHSAKSGPLLRISENRFISGLRDLVQEIHDTSPSRMVPQIIHFMKVARSGWRQLITDLSHDDMDQIVQDYADAAYRAREAEFDGVELHMAHAYTLSSFLSRVNPRRDEYGGQSLEGRLRLPLRVIDAVRQSVGDDFPIGVRYLGEEAIRNGYALPDAQRIGLAFAEAGLDYLSLSVGGKFEDARPMKGRPLYPYTGYSGDRCMPGKQYPDGCNVPLAEGVKRFINERGQTTPVITAGKIRTGELAESILAEERADLIGMARPLLSDPDLPKKLRLGLDDQILECIACNVCKALDEHFRKVTCFQWPKGSLQAPD